MWEANDEVGEGVMRKEDREGTKKLKNSKDKVGG
jgi:hypothetical protein